MVGRGKAVYLELIQHKKRGLLLGTWAWIILLLISGVYLFTSPKMACAFLVLGGIIGVLNILERWEVGKELDKRGDRARFYTEIEALKDPKACMKWKLLVLEHYVMGARKHIHLFTYDQLSHVEIEKERGLFGGHYIKLYVITKKDSRSHCMTKWKDGAPGTEVLEEAFADIAVHIEEQKNI